MKRIDVTEGEYFDLPAREGSLLRDAAERLRQRLRPSFSLLSEQGGRFRLSNVIGTVDIGGGVALEVSPKVPTGSDWTTAAVSLLTGTEALEVAGERRAGTSRVHNRLLDAIADIYLSRLARAFRQEGPIVLMEQVSARLPYLQGKLAVTAWARTALWQPHIFPVTKTELAHDNPYTQALVLVADTLAHATSNRRTRNDLRALCRDLSAGMSGRGQVSPNVVNRALPEQWSAYKPAWSLAAAVLSRSSLFGPTGRHVGVGIAIEAWPLLETLLDRSLRSAERVGQINGRSLSHRMQGPIEVLRPQGPSPQACFSAEPDGRLFENGQLVATFEAKYSNYDGSSPAREHTYQALATAAACSSPLAVLVYPNSFSPQSWAVQGFQGKPMQLAVIGLDMFKWLPPAIADSRGEQILRVVDELRMSGRLCSERVAA